MIRVVYVLIILVLPFPVYAIDDAHRQQARQVLDAAFEYLRVAQTPEGAWLPKAGPGVTGLVAAAMLRDKTIDRNDPTLTKAIDYILTQQRPDGGIHAGILENYNTSLSLMALGALRNEPRIDVAVTEAHDFLRRLQWSDQADPGGTRIDEDHPWYGGAGYGNKGRPDMSNTAMLVAGLNDSGLDCKDPAYIRAMTFINRLQGSKTNVDYSEQITPDGGFIYATSENKETIGKLQSYAQPPQEVDASGRSRLRTYGSMTYAGFMSYLYAQLDVDDPRVADAYEWLRQNYTVQENPRVGKQGYYYYLHIFARALSAWGEPTITTPDGQVHDWANDLIDQLSELQRPDGSFVNEADRWMEGDPILVTAFAVMALEHALED